MAYLDRIAFFINDEIVEALRLLMDFLSRFGWGA